MNYTFVAIACYITMRSIQVLLEGCNTKPWHSRITKTSAIITLYVALASIVVWYYQVELLGFDPKG